MKLGDLPFRSPLKIVCAASLTMQESAKICQTISLIVEVEEAKEFVKRKSAETIFLLFIYRALNNP